MPTRQYVRSLGSQRFDRFLGTIKTGQLRGGSYLVQPPEQPMYCLEFTDGRASIFFQAEDHEVAFQIMKRKLIGDEKIKKNRLGRKAFQGAGGKRFSFDGEQLFPREEQ